MRSLNKETCTMSTFLVFSFLSSMSIYFCHDVNSSLFSDCRALHFAAMIPGTTDVLELLLSHGADIDAPNSDYSTPLFFSCQSGNMFSASVLLARGADFRIRNNKGILSLIFLCNITCNK